VALMDLGAPASYLTLAAGTAVYSSDGQRLGELEHVLADPEKDIFDGLVIDVSTGPGGLRFADADQVAEVYERAVVLDIAAAEAEQLPEPRPAPAVMDSGGAADAEGPLETKLRRAWDLISGNY